MRLEKKAFLRTVQSSNHFAIWTWTPCHHCLGLSSLQLEVYLKILLSVSTYEYGKDKSPGTKLWDLFGGEHIGFHEDERSTQSIEAVAGVGLSRTYLPESDYIIPYGHLEFLNSASSLPLVGKWYYTE